jgi:hypothetical protein
MAFFLMFRKTHTRIIDNLERRIFNISEDLREAEEKFDNLERAVRTNVIDLRKKHRE